MLCVSQNRPIPKILRLALLYRQAEDTNMLHQGKNQVDW
jgi:hypothetical protein